MSWNSSMIYPSPSRKMLRLHQNVSQSFYSALLPDNHRIIEVFRLVLNYLCIYYDVPKCCIFRKTSYVLSCISDRVWIDDLINCTLITCK
jgi:hypothetical protein